ncbi:hypothetical protein KCP71_21460 [Salmonella enterica subsp. enterica]|nr:hypothetical protein KCP71_21460 [Salmonella enterica subsp. enterica]
MARRESRRRRATLTQRIRFHKSAPDCVWVSIKPTCSAAPIIGDSVPHPAPRRAYVASARFLCGRGLLALRGVLRFLPKHHRTAERFGNLRSASSSTFCTLDSQIR